MLRFVALLLVLALPAAASDEAWVPVREVGLELQSSSPLDFSAILPNAPITEANRLTVAEEGFFASAEARHLPVKLLCASLAWSPASGGFPEHADADRYARQLAMRGYNIARFHFVDAGLMFGRDRDFDFDAEALDRFHYLLAALKREGISWIFDGLTSWRGGYGGFEDRWEANGDLKRSVITSPEGFEHWVELQKRLYGVVNPYTGMSPLADPALALMVLVNEGGIEFSTVAQDRPDAPDYPEALRPGFVAWLKTRYPDTRALATAWGGLSLWESLESGAIDLPGNRYQDSLRIRDLQAHFTAIEIDATRRTSEVLRELGYRGAISNYNNWSTLQASLSRSGLDVVTMNTYFDWVSGYDPGASLTQQSSLADELSYLTSAAATRWLGRPFLLTEYDHLFWNRYRYEAGLAMAAYASLQSWDGICRHGHGPIVLRYGEDFAHKRQMLPYAIALDPVARAGETLAALLFRRGDVAPASHSLAIPLGEGDLTIDMQAQQPEALSRLALRSRIGLSSAAGETPTDVGRTNVYRSDTGEIALFPDRRTLSVVTPRTEAAAFETLTEPLHLSALTLERSDGPMLFSASSLDGAPLPRSRKILLIMATDAHNTGMVFDQPDERVIRDFGRLPVLIRPARIKFTLVGDGDWVLSPVGLDGVTHPALARGSGTVAMQLENSSDHGPTTFFLIERSE